jgi:uncharacterized protein YbaP (TraB family)
MKSRISILVFLFTLLTIANLFAQGNSLLWRISGKNIKHTSYLYGTMHSSDARVFHFSDSVYPAFEMCDGFAMEVLIDDETQATMLQNIFMKNDTSLKNLLSPLEYDSLQNFSYKNTGLNIDFFERMKPLYVAMMLEVMSNSDSVTDNADNFLDQFLQMQAAQMQKQIFGLETVQEQMRIFDIMSYQDQASLLMLSIRGYSNDTSDFEQMINFYLNNDLYNMMKFENDFSLPETLYNALITDRNLIMADRIDTMIHRRSMFIAVGAGHLGSQGGLVELLRNKGYTVLPVIPVYNNYSKDGWYRFQSVKNNFSIAFPSVPQISLTLFEGSMISEYVVEKKEQFSAAENFSVYVFPVEMIDSNIIKFLSSKNLMNIDFNNATEEKYFSFMVGEKEKGKGVMVYSGFKRYVILYSSIHKTKNLNRFTASFDLQ